MVLCKMLISVHKILAYITQAACFHSKCRTWSCAVRIFAGKFGAITLGGVQTHATLDKAAGSSDSCVLLLF